MAERMEGGGLGAGQGKRAEIDGWLRGTLLLIGVGLLVGHGFVPRVPQATKAASGWRQVYLPIALRNQAELPRPTRLPSTATVTVSPTPAATTEVPASPTPSIPQLPATGIFGVQLGVQPYDRSPQEFSTALTSVLDTLQTAGVRWLRVPVSWYAVEPVDVSPPYYDWSFVDLTLGSAGLRGLQVVAVVYGHPNWAASRSCGPVDRVPLERYGDFLARLAERYDGDGVEDAPGSPRVDYWEIGNEPDFAPAQAKGESDYGSCFGDEGGPASYAEHLWVASLAIHRASPTAKVVFGSVAYERFFNAPGWYRAGHRGPFRYGFTREVLTVLATKHRGEIGWPFIDAFALHNYNDFRDNWEANSTNHGIVDRELIDKVARFRELELGFQGRAFEWAELPLLVSEVSMADAPPNEWIARSSDYQAAYVGQVMVRALAAGARAAIWYLDQDYATGRCDEPDAWQTFGLLRSLRVARLAGQCAPNPLPDYAPAHDLEPKPALAAYRTVCQELGQAQFDGWLEPAQTGHWELQVYRFREPGGRYRLAAFVDHGQPLGRKIGGVPVADARHSLRVDESLLPDWSGRTRLVDFLGHEQVLAESPLHLTVDFRPVFISAVPPTAAAGDDYPLGDSP